MTEAEIIFAANDSGLTYYGMGKDRAKFLHHLQAFAALVEAAARTDEHKRACAFMRQMHDAYSIASYPPKEQT